MLPSAPASTPLARSPRRPAPLLYSALRLAPSTGHKIPAIENLGVLRDSIDALDLTDNAISSVSNFPLLRRLAHLVLSSNPIRTLSPTLATSLPNLRTLVIAHGALPATSLAHVGQVLGRCRRLEMLVLKGNPLESEKHYADWLVWNCKRLTSLDYSRIKDVVSPPSLASLSLPPRLASLVPRTLTDRPSRDLTDNDRTRNVLETYSSLPTARPRR